MTGVTLEEIDAFSEITDEFLEKIKSMPHDEAVAYVTDILIQAGILKEDGSEKEQIVTGDFFGW